MGLIRSIADVVIDRAPDELIGGLLVALAVALVMMGVFRLGRRKAAPEPTFVGALVFVAGVSCMVLAAGYVRYKEFGLASGKGVGPFLNAKWATPGPGSTALPGPWDSNGLGWSSGFHVVVAADRNRDGRLDPEEVARMVREADTDGDGSVDFHDIDRLIAGRTRPPVAARPSRKAEE